MSAAILEMVSGFSSKSNYDKKYYEWMKTDNCKISRLGDSIDKLRIFKENDSEDLVIRNIKIEFDPEINDTTFVINQNQLKTYFNYDMDILEYLKIQNKFIKNDNYLILEFPELFLIALQKTTCKLYIDGDNIGKIYFQYIFYNDYYRKYLLRSAFPTQFINITSKNFNKGSNYVSEIGIINELIFNKNNNVNVNLNGIIRNDILIKTNVGYVLDNLCIDTSRIDQINIICNEDQKCITRGTLSVVYYRGYIYIVSNTINNSDIILITNAGYITSENIWSYVKNMNISYFPVEVQPIGSYIIEAYGGNNNYMFIPNYLYTCNNLKVLMMPFNKIVSVDLNYWPNIEEIDLSYNLLNSITFTEHNKIKDLHCINLSYNELKEIKGFEYLPKPNNEIENDECCKTSPYLNLKNGNHCLIIPSLEEEKSSRLTRVFKMFF